jgi:hypothetical protein
MPTDLRIGRDARSADGIRVELHELPEPSRTGFLVAEDPARAIAAVGLRQGVEILSHVAGERSGEVVAQAQPLLVVVLEREYALVGAVLVRQELAERVGIFDEGSLDGLESVELIGIADRREHALGGGDLRRPTIDEAARHTGFQLVGF